MKAMGLNEISITLNATNNSVLTAPLYVINSTNVAGAFIQSTSTDSGNEHSIQKTSETNLLATNISEGTIEFSQVVSKDKDAQVSSPFLILLLK